MAVMEPVRDTSRRPVRLRQKWCWTGRSRPVQRSRDLPSLIWLTPQTCRIQYTGLAPGASMVPRTLGEEGVTVVQWTRPPEELRGIGDVLDAVTAVYVAMGTEAVRRERAPRCARTSEGSASGPLGASR